MVSTIDGGQIAANLFYVIENGKIEYTPHLKIAKSMQDNYNKTGFLTGKQINYLNSILKNCDIPTGLDKMPFRDVGDIHIRKHSSCLEKRTSDRVIPYEVNENLWKVIFSYDSEIVKKVKSLPGRKYIKQDRLWVVPKSFQNLQMLKDWGFKIHPDIRKWLDSITGSSKTELKEIPGLKLPLRPFQKEGVEFIESRNGRALVGDEMGLGKAQSLQSLILTENGFKPMGDMEVGDRVFGRDGELHGVTGYFPQGEKHVYEVVFSDGSKTECCNEHLWIYMTDNHKRRGQGWQAADLNKIMKLNTPKWIPTAEPPQFPEQDFSIPPYSLGVLLGDGYLSGTTPALSVADIDPDIIDNIMSEIGHLCKAGCIRVCDNHKQYNLVGFSHKSNLLKDKINDLELSIKSPFRFIPEQYFRGSVHQRIELLRGLMDTDGTCQIKENGSSSSSFSTTSIRLAHDVKTLVQSLGGRATIREYDRDEKGTDIVVRVFTVMNPFRTERKASRWVKPTRFKPVRYFKEFNYLGKKECACIRVDNPDSSYLTDEYIVTHNTPQALAWLQLHPEARPAVVICPASLKWNWYEESFKFMKDPKSQVIEGRPGEYPPELTGEIIIINYDILADITEKYWTGNRVLDKKTGTYKKEMKRRDVPGTGWWSYLKKYRINTLISDECHMIKDEKNLRTKAVQKMASRIPHVICLSGTPFLNRPVELFSTINLINPYIFPSFFSFAKRYCGAKKGRFGWDFKGSTNRRELHDILTSTLMIRRLKKDVLKELPEKVRSAVPVSITNRETYDNAERNFISYLESFDSEKALRAKSAEYLVKIGYLKKLAIEGKYKACVDWIDRFLESGEKLIVFTQHRDIIQKLETNYRKICGKVDGDVSSSKRQEVVRDFQKPNGIQLFLGNLDAASVGLTLTAASHVCFVEYPWSPGILVQAEDRIHRIGQCAGSVNIWYLVAKNTIDEKMIGLLERKASTIGAVLDGHEEEEDIVFGGLLDSFAGS